jgi:hypothetical protein
MGKTPNLDEATLRIARRMLNTPPKPHDEMKVRKGKKQKAGRARRSAPKRA